MNTKRAEMVRHALEYVGRTVLWGRLDCSELVAVAFLAVGLPDYRRSWRAQDFADNLPPVDGPPRVGDLGFYGADWQHVQHVVIHLGDGKILSASGASKHIKTEEAARRAGARVRIYGGTNYRRDIPFLGWRRSPLDEKPETIA